MSVVKSRVSVVIPFYNGSKFIEDAINSIKKQTLEGIDLVVVDDCSPKKGELEYLEGLQLKYQFTLVKHDENLGLPKAIKTGVENSLTEYVTILGQDDLLLSDKIEKQYELMRQSEHLIACYCGIQKLNVKTGEAYDMPREETVERISSGTVLEKLYKTNGLCLSLQGVMIKKNILEKDIYKIWNDISLDDWPVHLKIFEKYSQKIGYIDEALVQYRMHDENMSNDTMRIFSMCLEVISKCIPPEYRDAALKNQIRALEPKHQKFFRSCLLSNMSRKEKFKMLFSALFRK